MRAQQRGPTRRAAMTWAWCAMAAALELALYRSYQGHDARFHWFTHFFVGAGAALVAMSAVASATRRPVPRPLVWLAAGHLFAMFPDLLFTLGHVAHDRWMDVFLAHVSSQLVPGRNLTWYLVFLMCLALYLATLDRLRRGRQRRAFQGRTSSLGGHRSRHRPDMVGFGRSPKPDGTGGP